MLALATGRKATTLSNTFKPFAMTRRQVPEPQFKNGVTTSGSAQRMAETPDTKKVISPNLPAMMNVVAAVVDADIRMLYHAGGFVLRRAHVSGP